ncbi:hypothetical protein JNUCC1_01609 [Lentibacillus sp. JNUCC-1]|uniref:DnaD domain-containing protein n=1 Tax=Lentibacillus sp. JNUCC-1 TaxID=2654513 RepID=UPI001327D0F9|nr:DnaD domain protein [Lentibacillus sp. JNUCC-1]MUV37803.1 hypothetical protein [Lentibacillus sp. JNUCC-1]
MNYIKELNAFKEWKMMNRLSPSAVALWYALMSINNSVRWKRAFNAPNSAVQQLTCLSKQGVVNARTQLVDKGLIRYEKGNRSGAPVYQMISLVQSVDLPADPTLDLSGDQDLTIHKYKQKQKSSRRSAREEIDSLIVFEENFGKVIPIIREAILEWNDKLGDEAVIHAMNLTVRRGGKTLGYIEQILKEWTKAGLTTLDEVLAYEADKEEKRRHKVVVKEKSRESYHAIFEAYLQGVQANDKRRSCRYFENDQRGLSKLRNHAKKDWDTCAAVKENGLSSRF